MKCIMYVLSTVQHWCVIIKVIQISKETFNDCINLYGFAQHGIIFRNTFSYCIVNGLIALYFFLIVALLSPSWSSGWRTWKCTWTSVCPWCLNSTSCTRPSGTTTASHAPKTACTPTLNSRSRTKHDRSSGKLLPRGPCGWRSRVNIPPCLKQMQRARASSGWLRLNEQTQGVKCGFEKPPV